MKARSKYNFNLINILIFYTFGMLYFQLIEMFFNIKITEIVFLFSVLLIFIGMLKNKIKFGINFFAILLIGCLYLFFYFLKMQEIFSYIYPPIVLAILLPLLKYNVYYEIDKELLCNISYLSCIYLLLNLILYIFKYDRCFQLADILQFKGALPHTNMFCSIIICLFILNINVRDCLGFINRFLCTVIIITTGSRTYIGAIVLLIIVRLLTSYGKRTIFGLRFNIFNITIIILSPLLLILMFKYVPSMSRFIRFGFGGNGRQELTSAYLNAISGTSLLDQLFGFKLVDKYLLGIQKEFPHSFTENSYMGIYLLFGLAGTIYFGYYLICLLFKVKKFQTLAIIFIILITFFFQDILLSIQTGATTFVAVYFNYLYNRKKYKWECTKYQKYSCLTQPCVIK